MPRILKRPMFNRGGSSNQGIMDGLVDRTGLAEGTPKFDTGKMKEDASSILSKIAGLTPGGMMGKAAADIASMTKGNEAEIVKAIQKMLAVTPVGQVGEAIRILANRYRIDPAVVERIAKSQMTDANIQTDPSGSADEGFPSRPEFESSAEDTSIMPRTNRFDEEAFVPNLRDRYDRFDEEAFVPDQSFPESGSLEKGGGDGGELMPLPFPYERDDIERMPLPYPYDRDPNFFMEPFRPGDGGDPERGPFRPGDGGDFEYLNQGGRVDRRQYELGAFGERAKQTSDDVYGFMKDLVPPPETRLPLGSLGADLLSGKGFRDSAINAYGKFTEQDDKRQNYDRQLKLQAAGIGVKDAMAMRNKKSDVSKVQTLATDLMRNNPDKYPNTTVGKSAAFNEALRITETSPGPAKDTMIASLAKQLTPGDNVLGKPARFMRNNAQTIAEQSVNFRQRHPDKNFQTSITYGALKDGSFTFDDANIPVGTYFFDAATGRTLLRKTKGNGKADFITVDEFSLEELD